MKLELDELTRAVAKKGAGTGIKSISSEKPFMQAFAENVTQVMNVLDSIGVKDLFIEKAREELQGRLFRRMANSTKPETNSMRGEQKMLKPSFDLDKIITLALVWLERFIEKNGDMKLSQFRKEIDANRGELIKTIKSLGIGL